MSARHVRLVAWRPMLGTSILSLIWAAVGGLWRTPATAAELPFMLGSWEGRAVEIHGDRPVPCPLRIEIIRQEGALLWGYDVWRPTDPTGAVSTYFLGIHLLGSLNPDGTGGVLAKEDAFFSFRFLDPTRMEVEYVGIGKSAARAFVATLFRRGGTPEAPPIPVCPDMAGSWQGTYRYPAPEGAITDVFRLDLVKQEADILWMDDVWHALDPDGGKPSANETRDRVIGGFAPDATRGVLAKPDARFAFRKLDDHRMEVEFARVGGSVEQAMAFYCVLRRDGETAPATEVEWPVLTGAWAGTADYPQTDGVKTSPVQIEISKQDGPLLWAENVWHPLGADSGQPGPLTVRESLRGSLHPAANSGVLAQAGAQFRFRILSPDRLQVEFVRLRPGPESPMAFYSLLERAK